MEVIKYFFKYGEEMSESLSDGVYALGFFDGMHIGHRAIISETVKTACKTGLTPSVFTFPAESLMMNKSAVRLYSTQEKLDFFKKAGIKRVVLADFDSVFTLSPEDFVKLVLCRDLKCRKALSGFNFKFGEGAKGDTKLLRELLNEEKCTLTVIDEQKIEGKTVSSTLIRDALLHGDTEYANKMLGSPYFIKGEVKKGLGKGRDYGFPTVNIDLHKDCPLRNGVYRTALQIDEKFYTGVTNIGVCPTFGERKRHSETLICDFFADIYGYELKIYFLEYLREEKLFSSPEELKKQIDYDKEYSKKRNGEILWQEFGLN